MNFYDLKKRFIVASFVLTCLFVLLVFSKWFVVKIAVMLVLLLLAGVGIWEYTEMRKKIGSRLPRTLLVILTPLTTAAFFIPPFHAHITDPSLMMVCFSFFFIFLAHFRKIEESVQKIGESFLGLCYVSVPLGMIFRIFYPTSSSSHLQSGVFWLVYLIAVTKVTDVAAYFIGKMFGRRKLALELSPNKTIEGTVAGVLSSSLLSGIFYFFFDKSFQFPFALWLFLGLSLGVIGQIGDLAESLIKRDSRVKDSNQLPGLGGVLDMLDSLLFATPFFYFVMGYS
ncbi:MAG: phosphatidate cytidylyltransferase [Simkaniaceae bacterium]